MDDTSERINRMDTGRTLEEETVVTGSVPTRRAGYGADVVVEEDVGSVKNRVQWGPIVAGAVTALIAMLLLSILGLAIGSSAFEPGTDAADWGTAAGIWGGISVILALFLGGWVAARSAAVAGNFAGLMNGFLAGAATILVLLWLTTTGVTNLLGFLGNNVSDIAAVATDTGVTTEVPDAQEAQEAVTGAATDESTYDRVRDGAWGTLIAMLLALGAAAAGGLLGSNRRQDVIRAEI